MSKQSTYVEVGKRKLELTNLTKILYPEDEVSKAEIIQYYLSIAPTMLSHIKGSPLSLIRFPDGIHGEQFFQKNRPDWAPDWVEYVALGTETKKDYILATEEAALVWLANLACLEVHQMQIKRPSLDKAYYMVFDLDPPEEYDFEALKSIAFNLKDHIETYGYNVFVKTTGGKGLHVIVPLNPKWSVNEAFEAASDIAKPFEKSNPLTTLQIKKEARKGRVLIDIYRNRNSQTIICPYSLRGRVGCPVAAPITWDKLTDIKSSKDIHIRNVMDLIMHEGDAWEGIGAFSTDLHTKVKTLPKVKVLGKNAKHKSPEQLSEYEKKRDFDKTPEPQGLFAGGDNTGFVIHRHSASHLHYDLRLEQEGVLRSWAVPKGMPPRPGIKRLAVATEDHPMEYITFEGEIPKGQYGGGKMWVFANGKYEITKEKKDGFYFKLNSQGFTGEYRMHLMKDKEWLLERVDNPQIDMVTRPLGPMLADRSLVVPKGDFIYEMKWDGIRAQIIVNEGQLTILSRNKLDLTQQFPELNIEAFRTLSGVFDGEIVCFDKEGKPNFKQVIQRMQGKGEREIELVSKRNPAFCYLFDCLNVDGKSIIHEPLLRRRAWLEDSIRKGTSVRISEIIEDGEALFEATKKMGLEGIMAKEKMGLYYPEKRSSTWLKVKNKTTDTFAIIGYTEGKGNREELFGALHVVDVKSNSIYRGKVGTGFTDKKMAIILKELETIEKIDKPIQEKLMDDKTTVWVKPNLKCKIQYSELTENGTLRDPVFKKLMN